jgi:hypothetical protein
MSSPEMDRLISALEAHGELSSVQNRTVELSQQIAVYIGEALAKEIGELADLLEMWPVAS